LLLFKESVVVRLWCKMQPGRAIANRFWQSHS
jgi:hypothetical protein